MSRTATQRRWIAAVGFRDMGIPAAVWASVVPTISFCRATNTLISHPLAFLCACPDAGLIRDDRSEGESS